MSIATASNAWAKRLSDSEESEGDIPREVHGGKRVVKQEYKKQNGKLTQITVTTEVYDKVFHVPIDVRKNAELAKAIEQGEDTPFGNKDVKAYNLKVTDPSDWVMIKGGLFDQGATDRGYQLSCYDNENQEDDMPLKRKSGHLQSLFDLLHETKVVSTDDMEKSRIGGRVSDRPGVYQAAGMGEARERRMMQGDGSGENKAVRVTNLPEDITESAIRGIFQKCGQIEKVYVPLDDLTNLSRGFAFVTFVERMAAERALRTLHASKVGHVVLAVEWAKPPKARLDAIGPIMSRR